LATTDDGSTSGQVWRGGSTGVNPLVLTIWITVVVVVAEIKMDLAFISLELVNVPLGRGTLDGG
jgi:hypothetical protein